MSNTKQVDLAVIGGGSAGLAAATAAREAGVESIVVLERSPTLGGILRQCIHNGFGLHTFGEDLTGVEYAGRCIERVRELDIPCLTETFVLDITPERRITAMNGRDGLVDIDARAIVLAMGCRERPRGALMIPGWRGAGVFTAGTAQRYMNIEGYLPGRRVVILGSGDIGLIMARQFVVEGARVERVVEILPYSSGLTRNIAQCLEDFDIPISYSSTIVDIEGKQRVEAVVMAQVDANRCPLPGTERRIECDTLLISAGLIPENELSEGMGVALSPSTRGAVVDDALQTSLPGVFSCGNVLHVHDLVDHVSAEGARAGHNAARYLRGELAAQPDCVAATEGDGVAGLTPTRLRRTGEETCTLMFRSRAVYTDCRLIAEVDGRPVATQKQRIVSPGEMQSLTLPREPLRDAHSVRVRIEGVKQV